VQGFIAILPLDYYHHYLLFPMTEPTDPDPSAPMMLEIPRTENGDGSTAQPSPIATSLLQNSSLPTLMPETSLTFLLISGRRRTMTFPSSATVGRVKELVWNSWPSDWADVRPPAPNYLRILYLGKMLQDEDVLQTTIHNPAAGHVVDSSPASTASPPVHSTIVHLSIRPIAPVGENDDIKKKKRRSGTVSQNEPNTDGEQAGCCASCIIC